LRERESMQMSSGKQNRGEKEDDVVVEIGGQMEMIPAWAL
jgi:hypothetical protein